MCRRNPIKRTPVKFDSETKNILILQNIERETREEDIWNIILHYEMMVRQTLKIPYYKAISRSNIEKHKNYLHFEYIYEICRLKDWDYRLYIESQFDRAKKYWKTVKVPQPSMMYSVKAMKYFMDYLGNIQVFYRKDINLEKRKRGKNTLSVYDEIYEGIDTTLRELQEHLHFIPQELKAQQKVLYIYDNWEMLSPYFLWTVTWFPSLLEELSGKPAEDCITLFRNISRSDSIEVFIITTMEELTKKYNTPPDVEFDT